MMLSVNAPITMEPATRSYSQSSLGVGCRSNNHPPINAIATLNRLTSSGAVARPHP